MAAAALLTSSRLVHTNPTLTNDRIRGNPSVVRLRLRKTPPAVAPPGGGGGLRLRRFPLLAASSEAPGPENEAQTKKAAGQSEAEKAQEAWEQYLERFREEALRVKAVTLQAYDNYSKKATEVLMEASKKLTIHADQAQKDLSAIAQEIGEEGQTYLATAEERSPDFVKDIVETFKSLPKLKGISEAQDYHIGIPYGSFLTVGGFLDFMLTGRTSALRFGIILGVAILTLSISSLRSSRAQQPSNLLVKAQTAIALILFFREFLVFIQRGSLPKLLILLSSGVVTALYLLRAGTGDQKGLPLASTSSADSSLEGPSSSSAESSLEN